MKTLTHMFWAGALLLGGVLPARADILYNQPSTFPQSSGIRVVASQNDTSPGGFGNFATAYDSFSLSATSAITGVGWQGGYFAPAQQGPISAFTLTFYQNSNGQPGTALFSERVPIGNANETRVGLESGVSGDNLIFDYTANLNGTFTAQANTTYWLSIVPDLPFPPSFGLHAGTGPTGSSFQRFFGASFTDTPNVAFSLLGPGPGPGIPEPTSLALWGVLGLAGLGSRWRRRKPARA
jgi:hypothetical protein